MGIAASRSQAIAVSAALFRARIGKALPELSESSTKNRECVAGI